ncbi:hypothetical protein BFW86_05625 [Pseudomonas fluorescens]|nr:hypothetical protein BFW86_05625 [Pseudomonas fluorescens]
MRLLLSKVRFSGHCWAIIYHVQTWVLLYRKGRYTGLPTLIVLIQASQVMGTVNPLAPLMAGRITLIHTR